MKELYTWCGIGVSVLASTTGDVLLSRAMKQVGDVHALWRQSGPIFVFRRIFTNVTFFAGLLAMAVSFYSLLFALSWGDVSLVGPAAAALTFVANAGAAKIFLNEHVDHRRWMAALLIACGVALLAF